MGVSEPCDQSRQKALNRCGASAVFCRKFGNPGGPLCSSMTASASLIGRLGSSAFRLFTTTVATSLAGSCFSPESAHRPFHHGIRGRGGIIFRATLPGGRSKRTHELTSSIVPRGTSFHHLVELKFPPVVIGFTSASCSCSFSGPSELGAISPDAVHDNGQPSRQRDNRSFHPAPSGNLHRPGLEPRPFCRT